MIIILMLIENTTTNNYNHNQYIKIIYSQYLYLKHFEFKC